MACDCKQCRIRRAAFGEGETTEASLQDGVAALATVLGATLGVYFNDDALGGVVMQIIDGRAQAKEHEAGVAGHA